jgi:hypothetical protein
MFKFKIIAIIILFQAVSAADLKGQSFELSKESAPIVVSGTSTLHDWKMILNIYDCSTNFIMKGSQVEGIDAVTFSCKATDLKSDNSLMDRKAYSALKVTAFPEIKFISTSAGGITQDKNKFSGNLSGNLIIAGKSVAVSIPLTGALPNINVTSKIEVRGETELKMSDFDISPPTAMMGALKTGDKIKISFSFQFVTKPVQ